MILIEATFIATIAGLIGWALRSAYRASRQRSKPRVTTPPPEKP